MWTLAGDSLRNRNRELGSVSRLAVVPFQPDPSQGNDKNLSPWQSRSSQPSKNKGLLGMCLITIAHNAGKLPEPFARTYEHRDAPNVVNCEHSGKHWMMDHSGLLGEKDMFFTRPPPDPALPAVRQLECF
jgi:hypothetical protein